LQVPKLHLNDGLTHLGELFTRYQLPWPQVLSAESSGDHCEIWITAPADILASLQHRLRDENSVRTEFSKWSTVTLTCAGASASALPAEMVRKLADEGILAERVQLSSTSVTVFIEREQRSHGIRCLHQLVG
jgi:aspartate kinase